MNKEAYADFWYWINERHSIFMKKEAGEPKPWTDDPILQDWKFCNPFRTNDKQTRHLIRILDKNKDASPGEILFNIFAFRAFNLFDTYNAIAYDATESNRPWISKWDKDYFWNILARRESMGFTMTSGAYMIRGREGMAKRDSILMTLEEVWNAKDLLAQHIQQYQYMDLAWIELMSCKFWGWGPFTIYQVVLDLTYTDLLKNPRDINTWCVFGPGAEKGIREIWPDKEEVPNSEFLFQAIWLTRQQGMHLKDYMPIMTLQDIEFSLCELSKYRRIKAGGKSKVKYNGRS